MPFTFGAVSESNCPINLSGVTTLRIDSNLAVYNLPQSGILASIPFTARFGETLDYYDSSNSFPVLVSDHDINHIQLRLLDQDDNPLSDWLDQGALLSQFEAPYQLPPWRVHLEIENILVG